MLPLVTMNGWTLICLLTLKVPEKLLLYGLYVHYVVHICDFGMLRVKLILSSFEVILWSLVQDCCTFWKIDGNSFKSTNTVPGKKLHRGSGQFRPRNAKKSPRKKKRAPENCHRLQCKSLFNVADLVNGMWKVASEIFFFFPVLYYGFNLIVPWCNDTSMDIVIASMKQKKML